MRRLNLLIVIMLTSWAAISHPGIGIVKDSKGNVFYTDLKQVWKIDPAGKKSIAVQSVHSHELFIDEKDNLYGDHLWYNGEALDTWGHFVWKLSANGSLEKVIPSTEGFRKDFSFVRDHQGRMYHAQGPVGCQHIVRINTDNAATTLGDKCLENVRWMTATASGQVYFVDEGNVMQVDPSGVVTTVASEVPDPGIGRFFMSKLHYLSGLAVDKAQNVYVCDVSAKNLKKISRKGEVTVAIETGSWWAPIGILLDENTGDIWLLESTVTNDVRVERVSTDGKRVVY